jgi:ABC-type transport system involved in cytochrome c biogenesis ATPase subunit
VIQVRDLAKSFHNRPVVRGLSFSAKDGAITGLLGANGAGKTTTLRMICGVLQPESGSVTIDPAGTGALLDHMGIYPRLTVRENLAYFGMLRGMPPAALAGRIREVLATLGLEAIADRRTAGFSQGERMKTALGRAILHAPQNLLLHQRLGRPHRALAAGSAAALARCGRMRAVLQPRARRSQWPVRPRGSDRPRTRGGAGFARRPLPPDGQRVAGRRFRKIDRHSKTGLLACPSPCPSQGASRMLNPVLVVARKEAIDSMRDTRSVISSLMYALMGPAVVFMVSLAPGVSGRMHDVLAGMMSVFTLVAAFVGGMNVAMDTVAGERERQSLLPLLMNPIRRRDIVWGKWLAVGLFSAAGLILNLAGFAIVFAGTGMHLPRLAAAVGILPLALLAASVQLLVSTVCRAVKEAHTYLSMLIFLPMGLGLFQVFFPAAARGWFALLPVLGQQLQLERWMKGGAAAFVPAAALGCFTIVLALLVLEVAANRLHRDEIVYGS